MKPQKKTKTEKWMKGFDKLFEEFLAIGEGDSRWITSKSKLKQYVSTNFIPKDKVREEVEKVEGLFGVDQMFAVKDLKDNLLGEK